jgi:hypothetical protein
MMPVSRALICAAACCCGTVDALELRGLADVRLGTTDSTRSWTRDGLDKMRWDQDSDGLRLGHVFLGLEGEVLDGVSAAVVASASDDRGGFLDVNEAWLGWNPVPRSPWKMRAKLGAFFPPTNLEIDYDSVGWTPARTVSASAINAWIGEELRIQGLEFSLARNGRLAGSVHDFGFTAALFGRNDPAGSLLAWRGWSIGDRITGLTEPIRMAELPVFGPAGPLPAQARSIHIAREIDHRAGYYLGAHYGLGDRLRVELLRYDNRGDPLVERNGQYSWRTEFEHLGVLLRPGGGWTWRMQALRGTTLMGPDAVRLSYDAWYVLAEHPLGAGHLAMRFDRFRARDYPSDILPEDPNAESGRALAIAYMHRLGSAATLVAEVLRVESSRAARALVGAAPDSTGNSLTVAIRFRF